MNPYEDLPSSAFWKLTVSNKSMFDINDLWAPKFNIRSSHKVATYGSCFAQHIGNALKSRGFKWLIAETPPHGLNQKNIRAFNYNVFSARTGNIYTTSLLKQWVEWALGKKNVPSETWIKEGRFYDPFRPKVEPEGFKTEKELRNSQFQTVESFRKSILEADFFVFTLGLTESWVHKELNYEYPMCPGTVAGEFDEEKHGFVNQQYPQVIANLKDAINLMRELNKNLRFILTVSPVPLTATKSGNNVVVATMESKSVLRAVAGQLTAAKNIVDYFPSYEIISSPVFKGTFFEPNQRGVNPFGVNFVMDSFFNSLRDQYGEQSTVNANRKVSAADTVCEEELLEAFGKPI